MGELVRWFFDQGGQLIESVGIIVSLCFAGIAFLADARTRKADILIRITEGHRNIWSYFDQNPELVRIFKTDVDLNTNPPTTKELRFVQFVINHLIITFKTKKLRIYDQPEGLEQDIQGFFSLPIPREVWKRVRRFQDSDFIAFMESSITRR